MWKIQYYETKYRKSKFFKCSKCGGKVVNIVYGEPGPELYEIAERKEVVLGGCCIHKKEVPQWACCECERQLWKK